MKRGTWGIYSQNPQTKEGENDKALGFLWIFPFIVPLLTIFFTSFFKKWTWGLMDDLQILSSGTSIGDRMVNYFHVSRAFGQFKPLWALHSGIFYTIFENHPTAFYFFRVFEIFFVLLIWGVAAYRITKKKISIILLPAVTLSFHYFYDSIFYLSSQEIIGLFFLGISLHFFLSNLRCLEFANTPSQFTNKFSWSRWWLGGFFLLCAFGSKEPFVSSGIAFGLFYIYSAWTCRVKGNQFLKLVFLCGILLVCITMTYGLILNFCVKSSYTSSYSVLNGAKIIGSLTGWFKKDFLNHLPWVLATLSIMFLGNLRRQQGKMGGCLNSKIKLAVVWGLLFYFCYLLILLPWNPIAYYATPFGVYFAFIVTVLISDAILNMKLILQYSFVLFSLVSNQFICLYALERESTYQYDTINLMQWLKVDYLKHKNLLVFCNAMEASGAIPGHLNRISNLDMASFHWTTTPDGLFEGRPCDYYLYSPRFHSIDLEYFKGWDIGFLSKSWIIYVRPSVN